MRQPWRPPDSQRRTTESIPQHLEGHSSSAMVRNALSHWLSGAHKSQSHPVDQQAEDHYEFLASAHEPCAQPQQPQTHPLSSENSDTSARLPRCSHFLHGNAHGYQIQQKAGVAVADPFGGPFRRAQSITPSNNLTLSRHSSFTLNGPAIHTMADTMHCEYIRTPCKYLHHGTPPSIPLLVSATTCISSPKLTVARASSYSSPLSSQTMHLVRQSGDTPGATRASG